MTIAWWRTDARVWSAQGWSLELRGDELAEIRYAGRLALRAVRATVRDHGWLTVPAVVESVDESGDRLTLTLRHEGLGARITSRLMVGAVPGELRIEWDADNGPAFDTCRTGLVALHPATDAGRPSTVEHPDGGTERVTLPTEITPHQPIREIRELRIDDGPEVRFDGDVFEMEDQRNWSDASFKTYSRPLALPYPYRLDDGEQVRQSIRIRMPDAPATRGDAGHGSVISLRPAGPLPEIGVEASTAPDPVESSDIGDFRVVQLDLTTPNWRAALDRAARDGLPLDVRLITDGDPRALCDAAHALREARPLRVAAFDPVEHVSTGTIVDAVCAALTAAGVSVPVLAGTRAHFTELNRERHRIPADVDGIAYTITPLFHSVDTEQLIEALGMQRLIAAQSVRIADGRPVHIGPVTLRPRFNNVATTPEPAPTRADLSEGYGSQFTGAVDERQHAPELAAWLIASAAALAVPGVAAISWFETVGPRGVLGTPAVEALRALLALEGTLLSGGSPDGLVWAMGARGNGGDVVLAANLDRRARTFSVAPSSSDEVVVSLEPGTWTRLSPPRPLRE